MTTTKEYAAMLYRLADVIATEAKRLGMDGDGVERIREAATRLDTQTVKINWLKKQRDELLADIERCYKMLLSEPDTQGALFKAENILREALASVKGSAA